MTLTWFYAYQKYIGSTLLSKAFYPKKLVFLVISLIQKTSPNSLWREKSILLCLLVQLLNTNVFIYFWRLSLMCYKFFQMHNYTFMEARLCGMKVILTKEL